MRLRLEKLDWSDESYKAEIRAIGKTGIINKKYLSPEKIKEVEEYGYAYCNQPKERVL